MISEDYLSQSMMDDTEGLCSKLVAEGSLSCRDLSSASNYTEYTNVPFKEVATSFMQWSQFRPQIGTYSQVSSLLAATVETVVTGTSPEEAMNNFANDLENALGADAIQRKI